MQTKMNYTQTTFKKQMISVPKKHIDYSNAPNFAIFSSIAFFAFCTHLESQSYPLNAKA